METVYAELINDIFKVNQTAQRDIHIIFRISRHKEDPENTKVYKGFLSKYCDVIIKDIYIFAQLPNSSKYLTQIKDKVSVYTQWYENYKNEIASVIYLDNREDYQDEYLLALHKAIKNDMEDLEYSFYKQPVCVETTWWQPFSGRSSTKQEELRKERIKLEIKGLQKEYSKVEEQLNVQLDDYRSRDFRYYRDLYELFCNCITEIDSLIKSNDITNPESDIQSIDIKKQQSHTEVHEVISNSSQSLLKIDGDKLHRFIHSIAVPSTKKLNFGLLELKGQRCAALINLVINNRLIEIDEEKVRNNKVIVNTSKIFEHLKSLRPDINFGSYSGMQKYFSIKIHEDVKEIYNNYQKQYKSFN